MNRSAVQVSIAALLLIAACAVFLFTWQTRQQLGRPGVRIINEPIYGVDDASDGATNTFLVDTNSIYLPEHVMAFESTAPPLSKKVIDWLPEDTTFGQRVYRSTNGFSIQASIVLMGKDRTSIHKPQFCLSSQGWTISPEELISIPITRPLPYNLPAKKLTARQTFRNKNGRDQTIAGVFIYWFVADNQLTAKHEEIMWRIAGDLLRTGVLQRWAYVTYFSVCPPGQEQATYEHMREFIAHAVPEFQLTPAPPKQVVSATSDVRRGQK